MSDCALPNGRWSAPTHSPAEDELTVMAHFTDGSERPCTMNRMGRELDYLECDGERYERVRECENLANHQGCNEFVCSECGVHYLGFRFNCCPNCGAKVKVGE